LKDGHEAALKIQKENLLALGESRKEIDDKLMSELRESFKIQLESQKQSFTNQLET
jgi:hypothetical protein